MKLDEILSPAKRDDALIDWLFANFAIADDTGEIDHINFISHKMLKAGKLTVDTETWILDAKKNISLLKWPVKFDKLNQLSVTRGSEIGNYGDWPKVNELVIGKCKVAPGFADYVTANVKYVELHDSKLSLAEFDKLLEAQIDLMYNVNGILIGFDESNYFVHDTGSSNPAGWTTSDVFEFQNYLIEKDLHDKLFKA
ncbi:hypothetical protein RsoM2USA_277 [Ralstonia phage RsoM2USA]|nr:hypothetical protein RsoM2USA_277 [Ralstonia phage RsoM2USA]